MSDKSNQIEIPVRPKLLTRQYRLRLKIAMFLCKTASRLANAEVSLTIESEEVVNGDL